MDSMNTLLLVELGRTVMMGVNTAGREGEGRRRGEGEGRGKRGGGGRGRRGREREEGRGREEREEGGGERKDGREGECRIKHKPTQALGPYPQS